MTDKTKKALLDGIGLAVSFLDMLLLNKILSDHSRRIDELESRIGEMEDLRRGSAFPEDGNYAIMDAAKNDQAHISVIEGFCASALADGAKRDHITPMSIHFVDSAKNDRHIMTARLVRGKNGSVRIGLAYSAGPDAGRSIQPAYTIAGTADTARTARLIYGRACTIAMGERVVNKEAVWLDGDAAEYLKAIWDALDHALDDGTCGTHTCGIVTTNGPLPVEIAMERTKDSAGRPFLAVLVNDKDDPRPESGSFPAVRYDRQNAGDAARAISRYAFEACGRYGYGCPKRDAAEKAKNS